MLEILIAKETFPNAITFQCCSIPNLITPNINILANDEISNLLPTLIFSLNSYVKSLKLTNFLKMYSLHTTTQTILDTNLPITSEINMNKIFTLKKTFKNKIKVIVIIFSRIVIVEYFFDSPNANNTYKEMYLGFMIIAVIHTNVKTILLSNSIFV